MLVRDKLAFSFFFPFFFGSLIIFCQSYILVMQLPNMAAWACFQTRKASFLST